MQLAEWLDHIESLHPKAWDLGLERVAAVANYLDVVKPAPTTFLVGGTNGKGSVCAYIAGLCRELGLKTGVTTSPHLLRFNERVVVDGVQASDELLSRAFARIEAARGDISLTYFEFAALAALLIFREANVDVAVLEVGLGGRLDAMNLVAPDVSVITRIALDHQSWLGDTREAIGAEKAGIMRRGKPCILADSDMPVSIHEHACNTGSRLLVPGLDYIRREDLLSVRGDTANVTFRNLPRPRLSIENAAAAVQAVFSAGFEPSQDQVAHVFSNTLLPARFQIINGERRTVLDVAHNPDAAAYLLGQLKLLSFERCHAVAGMYADKDYELVIGMLSSVVDSWYFPAPTVSRGAPVELMAASVPAESGCRIRTYDKVTVAYEDAVRRSSHSDVILVFGSFPVVASVLEFLQAPV
ncbi:MAG: bifunctional tetrahydrofolate synthase/dihydrofolate synthase [Pseudomonadales bacterium]